MSENGTDVGLYGLDAENQDPINPPTPGSSTFSSITRVSTKESAAVAKLSEPLNDENWTVWRERMRRVLQLCEVEDYVDGQIPRPFDAMEARNWDWNDNYAQVIIMNNISQEEMVHVGRCRTANLMWNSLEAVHESKGHQTIIAIIRNLFHTVAKENTNISEHLGRLKTFWERINLIGDNNFKITDLLFKIIISSSLPASWDSFTEAYVGGYSGINSNDPKKLLNSQQFIGILKEEFLHREEHSQTADTVNQVITVRKPLARHIATTNSNEAEVACKQCEKAGHLTQNCIYLGKSKCPKCNKFHTNDCWKCESCEKYGHLAKNCWKTKGKGKRSRSGQGEGSAKKKQKQESASLATVEETVAFNAEQTAEDTVAALDDSLESYINDPNNELIRFYDWLADCATTSHVSNQLDAFITYQHEDNITVAGVGNIKAQVAGRGTVELLSTCNGHTYCLQLKNVLHIPTNRNSLLSLGRWDDAGGSYTCQNGVLTLTSADNKKLAEGIKGANNLYKMQVKVRKMPQNNSSDAEPPIGQTFEVKDANQTWETWHKRYGHVSYSGLRRLYHDNMVDGFTVDLNSPMPNCVACTEAKQTVEPYGKHHERDTEPGELTHIDLWGKYEVTSINGHQYYIVLVDDASRFITVDFLKGKDQAAQIVKNYLTYLKTQGKNPKAMRTDRGKEFINEVLTSWCNEHGIKQEPTAPFSPPQNGVAERSNRTLVELVRAMIKAQNLPEFLWEPAIKHAAYLRNRSHSKSVPKTPYEIWNKRKPNVSHLCEFGAPVWVLLQGQNEARKILPKSKRRAYVGYDDGSKSVLYYNAETRNILTSRNFRFLTLNEKETPPEEIEVQPDLLCEGEKKGGTLLTGINKNIKTSDSSKRKRDENEEGDIDTPPRKTRGKRVDYKYLNDPFSDEEEDDCDLLQETFATAITIPGGDEPTCLKEAKASPEWEEWEHAVKSEMDQLHKMGTWILVKRPTDAIPISNRWVFIKKFNKHGNLLKYKGRLVAKGCSQRPGYDYQETYSPVVRMETIRAILAIAVINGYSIAQMDVKGAYLNGTLKEKVYMLQPEGFEDGTDRVCQLIKTLYGLKQSGREWNKELDDKLTKHHFIRLKSDPCAYVRRNGKNVAIMTVWVDDLLIFASSDEMLNGVKTDLCSEWEVTDLGEPAKIVGIEITRTQNSIKISQQKYIESILKKEEMENLNPVSTPMDPNVKLVPNPDGNKGDRSNSFARLLAELQFLANATRPDIAYAVNRLAAYTANPSLQHVSMLKRMLRYLAGTKTHGITYSKNHPKRVLDGENLFHGYADAAYANTDDYKSTSGYVFQMGGGAITWRSKKQTTIALSSTEAEYVALSEAGREACWLRSLFEELGENQSLPTLIKGDNDGSIAMACNPQFHKRSKHIATRWHWVHDMVENKTIEIESCHDPEQTADILTKALPRPKHLRHVAEMGLAPT